MLKICEIVNPDTKWKFHQLLDNDGKGTDDCYEFLADDKSCIQFNVHKSSNNEIRSYLKGDWDNDEVPQDKELLINEFLGIKIPKSVQLTPEDKTNNKIKSHDSIKSTASEFSKNQSIIITALVMSSLDGNFSDEESEVLKNSPFFIDVFKNLTIERTTYPEIVKRLNAEKNLAKLVEEELSKNKSLFSETEIEEFIFGLIDLIISDGKIDDSEMKFLQFVLDILGKSELIEDYCNRHEIMLRKKLDAINQNIIDDYTDHNYKLSEAVMICAFLLTAIDGDIDDKEIKIIRENTFFSKYYSKETESIFVKLLKADKALISLVEKTFSKVFIQESLEFKRDFLWNLYSLSLGDGKLEETETNTIMIIAMALYPGDAEGLELNNSVMSEYADFIKKETEEIKRKNIEKNKSGCFIATATMSDYDNPIVIDLRRFRDEKLQNYYFGRVFIELYYFISPPIANIIARVPMLRKISYFFLIKPLHSLINKY